MIFLKINKIACPLSKKEAEVFITILDFIYCYFFDEWQDELRSHLNAKNHINLLSVLSRVYNALEPIMDKGILTNKTKNIKLFPDDAIAISAMIGKVVNLDVCCTIAPLLSGIINNLLELAYKEQDKYKQNCFTE